MPPTAADAAAAARAAASAVLAAAATLRERPDATRLAQAALRAARAALAPALANGPLALAIVGDGIACAGIRLVAPWLATLRAAGIGALVLLPGMPGAECARLLRRLANVPGDADGDGEAVARALLGDGSLPHVRVRAASADDLGALTTDWSPLPPPPPPAPSLAAMVARDVSGNLPRRLAARVLDDLDVESPADANALPPLLARMLGDRDHAGAAWLLEAAGAHPTVPADVLAELDRAAARGCDDAALLTAFARGDRHELLALAALALQLGGDSTTRFARAAAQTAGDIAQFLADAVPDGVARGE